MNKRSRSTETSEQDLKQQNTQERASKRKSLFSTMKTILKKIHSPKISPVIKKSTPNLNQIEKVELQSPRHVFITPKLNVQKVELQSQPHTLEPNKNEQKFLKSCSFEIRRCISVETIGETPYFMLPFEKDEFDFATETMESNLFSEGSFCLDSLDEDHPVLLQMLGLSK
jgi:hypothetical protein